MTEPSSISDATESAKEVRSALESRIADITGRDLEEAQVSVSEGNRYEQDTVRLLATDPELRNALERHEDVEYVEATLDIEIELERGDR